MKVYVNSSSYVTFPTRPLLCHGIKKFMNYFLKSKILCEKQKKELNQDNI